MMLTKSTFFVFLWYLVPSKSEFDRICATNAHFEPCQQLARDSVLACNFYLHNVDCLLSIENNRAHVGRISGWEALLGANLLSNDVVVIGEITSRHPPPETVVIVKRTIDSITDLKDKKFCHPGFKHDNSFSRLMLQEFENKINQLNVSLCANNATLLEKHISSLQTFFGESCRPGPWTYNSDFDKVLKEKYSSLCTLCGNEKCDIDYSRPFNDSLKCLLEKDADVAVSTLSEAYDFFNLSSSNSEWYKYLCPDNSVRSTPCVWSSELPSLLVAERNEATPVKDYLENKLKSKILESPAESEDTTEIALIEIFELKRFEKVKLFSNYKSLQNYVTGLGTVPSFQTSKMCDTTLKWCTYSYMEQEKCKWLSQAAMNWGIQPVVECVRSEGHDELSCLDDIKKKKADIVVASSDYAYISLNKGLKSLAYPETYSTSVPVVLTVIRADDDTIKTFKDLKEKKACLPRFGGKDHLAFVDTLRQLKIIDDQKCDYGTLLSDFVGSSCVPGVRSSIIKESTDYVDKDKLCSVCRPINVTRTSTYCNDDIVNKYFGRDGALNCLYDKAGDFAVISELNATETYYDYKAICKNNTVSSRRGLHVDAKCALNTLANSEVVSDADNPKNPDITLALKEFEKWFGQDQRKPFHLFNKFNETLNLLFEDSTPGLSFTDDKDYIKNYKNLLENVRHCKLTSASNMTKASILVFITILVSFIIIM